MLVAAVLVSCSGGESADEVARTKVAAKEKALSAAREAAQAAADAFCDSSRNYVLALDRYGDVLTASGPTVGDVNDAGADLAAPRDDAVAAAEAAVEAHQAVIAAEDELAEAQSDLAAATSGSPGASSTSASTGAGGSKSPTPLVPTETVQRVKRADADFDAAQQGISPDSPIAQASQQFNAAAVALEMAWFRLLADAGCLTDEQEKQAQAAVGDYTSALQKSLAKAGYYDGEVDGVYGPETVEAVEALQQSHGLPVTGTVDKATDAALQADLAAKGGAAAQQAVASTAAVQQVLKLAGYWQGPVDGEWTTALTDALKAFQTELGVKPTGEVDAKTVAALEKAIADASRPATPASTPAPSPTSSTASPADSPTATP